MKISIAQVNTTVGNLEQNAALIIRAYQEAVKRESQLVLFPEMSLTGYPPEDLVFKPIFVKDNLNTIKKLSRSIKQIPAIIGFVDQQNGHIYNAAAWIEKGKIRGIYHKHHLPNYGVFDENRYFQQGSTLPVFSHHGFRIAITICEDIWQNANILSPIRKKKLDLILNLSASPFHQGKINDRLLVGKNAVKILNAPLVYCNAVGGQDELVFDGGSFALNKNGRVAFQAPLFETGLYTIDFDKKKGFLANNPVPTSTKMDKDQQALAALTLGIRDYVGKNGFNKVTLGLSGGIDSALVAALAVRALGSNRVIGVTMPSQFNSTETQLDAIQLAENLGIKLLKIPIKSLNQNFLDVLNPFFKGTKPDIAEENLQARIRGTLLMGLSNKFGWLVLTTGNKSEMSTGYCTLYGDTAGGFAVLKDVIKTTVYRLSKLINKEAQKPVIPQSTIDRPPTAELKFDQRDEDSLGSYAELDSIIQLYVEENKSYLEISNKFPNKKDYIRRIVQLIDRNEYKRRQAPPGIKISPRAFGRDHRMPITNHYAPPKVS